MPETDNLDARWAPALDPGAVADLLSLQEADCPHVIDDMISEFVRDTPGRLARLAGTVAADDAENVAWLAHKCKGICGIFGAYGMVRLCEKLEQQGRAGDLRGSAGLLDQLAAEFDRVKEELERLSGTPHNGGQHG